MDVCESQKSHSITEVDAIKRPLVPAEKNDHGISTTRQSGSAREVSSRYMSQTPSASWRCTSTRLTRNTNSTATQLAPKRALSAEKKRPKVPPSPSPSRPTTPLQDTSVETQLSFKKVTGSRLAEVLWPSTMRSLSVSFQSDCISIPVTKQEKPVCHALSDRTLKPSSNVATKQANVAGLTGKPTAERKRSPLKGKSSSDQSENSKPLDGAYAGLIDQHRWPSRAGGKLSLNIFTRSMDLEDRTSRSSNSLIPCPGVSSFRRLSCEGVSRPLQKTISDAAGQALIDEIGKTLLDMKAVDDTVFKVSTIHKLNSPRSPENTMLANNSARTHSLRGTRLPSPSRTSISRGVASPSRTRPSMPTSSTGASPSQTRPSSPTRQSSATTTSVLSFVADIRKGKKIANQLEDAHHLRLLYNRYLQWRFANAQAVAALLVQRITAEKTLYNVWRETLELWDSVIMSRVELQQSKLELKLNMMLSEQLANLENWALLQGEHCASLAGAIKDLESSTLRLPVIGGAKGDIESLKSAFSSAFDAMWAMASSVCSVLSKVEGMSSLVSEVAELAAQERATLDECELLMALTAAMQVEDYCLRAQLIQQLQGLRNIEQPIWAM